MASEGSELPVDSVVASIERVLEAERAAEEKLAECRRQAHTAVASARESADAIRRRTDARISKLHVAYMQRIQAQVVDLLHPENAAADNPGERRRDSLSAAAERLAVRLTSDAGERTR
jgi:hypothetical protein